MTVADLKKFLTKMPKDAIVILAVDVPIEKDKEDSYTIDVPASSVSLRPDKKVQIGDMSNQKHLTSCKPAVCLDAVSQENIMLDIGFGLVLYHLLCVVGVVVFALLAFPFVMNIMDGKGYVYNLKLVWGAVSWFLRLGFGKRKQNLTADKLTSVDGDGTIKKMVSAQIKPDYSKQAILFCCLQAADVASTLVGFACGLVEANPVLHFFPALGPVAGLLFNKALASIAVYCYVSSRSVPKWKLVNGYFMVLLAWNCSLVVARLIGLV